MCGIYGIIDYSGKFEIDGILLRKIGDSIQHRGPDDAGIYLKKEESLSVGLGHRRLSIIDLSSAGHQPMCNEDKSVWVIFNGEIYNYKELRVDLQNKGHKFISDTDTEVLIHLYEEYGKECVQFIRGMFAFAVWDEKQKALLLAKDRIGKKPLLYYYAGGTFCFASEFTALLESAIIKKDINYEAIHYYLTFKYIPTPLTIYKNVFKLPAAHRLILKDKKITIEKYWELDYSQKKNISENEASEEILKLLKESVKIRLRSDVPLGVFLSGGIDSSIIVALMSQLMDKQIRTFSIGFSEGGYNELKYARNIAKRFDTQHHEFVVKPDALKILPLLVERYGEPYADSSCIPTYYVAQQTKQYVTVALNGDGGDELFAGYERYQAMLASEIYQKIPNFAKGLISKAIIRILPHSVNSKNRLNRLNRFIEAINLPVLQRYLKWIGIFDDVLKHDVYTQDFSKLIHHADSADIIRPFLNNLNDISLLDSLLWTDTMTYLPDDLLVKVDIASMANSLEARSPFLDHKLIEFVVKLPAGYKMKGFIKKYILKKAIKGLIPQENIQRTKMGFAVPVGEWFRNELKDFLCATLLSKQFFNRGYFRPEAVRGMINQHVYKQKDYSPQLWTFLMLELWHQRFID